MNRRLIEQLKRDEGVVLHAYRCSLGFLTLGIGRLVDGTKGGGITMAEAEFLLNNDLQKVDQQLRDRFPWFSALDEVRQAALMNMTFQLGIGGVCGFPKMLACLRDGRYADAETHALDSQWSKQTPARARRVAKQLATGAWE